MQGWSHVAGAAVAAGQAGLMHVCRNVSTARSSLAIDVCSGIIIINYMTCHAGIGAEDIVKVLLAWAAIV